MEKFLGRVQIEGARQPKPGISTFVRRRSEEPDPLKVGALFPHKAAKFSVDLPCFFDHAGPQLLPNTHQPREGPRVRGGLPSSQGTVAHPRHRHPIRNQQVKRRFSLRPHLLLNILGRPGIRRARPLQRGRKDVRPSKAAHLAAYPTEVQSVPQYTKPRSLHPHHKIKPNTKNQ